MTNPFNPGVLITTLNSSENDTPLTKGERGAITGSLNVLLDNDEQRHAFLFWAFGVTTSKDMTARQWHGIRQWLNARTIDGRLTLGDNCYSDSVNWLSWRAKELAKESIG